MRTGGRWGQATCCHAAPCTAAQQIPLALSPPLDPQQVPLLLRCRPATAMSCGPAHAPLAKTLYRGGMEGERLRCWARQVAKLQHMHQLPLLLKVNAASYIPSTRAISPPDRPLSVTRADSESVRPQKRKTVTVAACKCLQHYCSGR